MQGFEGAPDAWIVFDEDVRDAARDLATGDDVLVLTWLHEADRDVHAVHPRDDRTVPERGVFSTRSPDRPNPIGLHRVEVLEVDGLRIRVRPLEAIDGTPVVDVKPVLRGEADRCSGRLLLVALDGLFRTLAGDVRVHAELLERSPLPEQVPAPVERHFTSSSLRRSASVVLPAACAPQSWCSSATSSSIEL